MSYFTLSKRALILAGLFFLTNGYAVAQGFASSTSTGYAGCTEVVLSSETLAVEDLVSSIGPSVEDPQLISLANGRKAVVFGVRGLPYAHGYGQWNVRYSVRWHDACGRLLPQGSSSIDGFALYPNEYRTVEVVAFQKEAVRATLRVYLD
jgi:hypothetical protein